ncbi:hypothetical protein [Aquitalea sp. USM4]|uniref:hypothetical protein n=1 Tax=Aquitalea sp. USM4 TaxID=1590041 RepID=UPI00103C5FAE|nr:hypothetical protein [Aquitalea sp. USM4]QBJ80489.1 hypothetical protein DKK66_19770 [Aquitalea sp. USM4]
MVNGIINGKPGIIGPYSCHNQPRQRDGLDVPDGWTDDGRRKMRRIPSVNTLECHFDKMAEDVRCAGCKWGEP